MRRIGSAVGQYVASPVVESMDVNAILQEVDWNEVLDKIDVNENFFDKVDVNKIFDRVDWNRQLDRIDINRHLGRVDWDELIRRSNLEEIISRSTSGVFSGFTSLLRTRLAWVDQWGQRLCRCYCCTKRTHRPPEYLPPRPGRPEDSGTIWENPGKMDSRHLGRSLQFRTCGALMRLFYSGLDQLIVWLLFTLCTTLGERLTSIFTNDDEDLVEKTIPKFLNHFAFELAVVFGISFFYWILFVGCFGRTISMSVLGLLMVDKSGTRVTFWKVFFQAFLGPLNLIFFGWLIGFCRRDGAFLSDVIGGVRVVYAWDTRQQENRNIEIAMSLGDYVERLPERERRSLLSGEMPDKGNDGAGGDIEITNLEDLEDGARRWGKDNM